LYYWATQRIRRHPIWDRAPAWPSKTQHSELKDAFLAYEQARLSRTKMITRLSKVWGHVGLWRAAPLAWLRDRFYQVTPDAIFLKILRDQYSYDPGGL
jgi:hypothetical protein